MLYIGVRLITYTLLNDVLAQGLRVLAVTVSLQWPIE